MRQTPAQAKQCAVFYEDEPMFYDRVEKLLRHDESRLTVFSGRHQAKIAIWHTVNGQEYDDQLPVLWDIDFDIVLLAEPIDLHDDRYQDFPIANMRKFLA
jgi:hypothetical protein